MKAREIDELVNEHNRIVTVVEQKWTGEFDQARLRSFVMRVSYYCISKF